MLLFIGLKQATKPPTTEHPLGFGKVTYFWSFVVALMLFSMGGLFSIYEGWHKLREPGAANQAWIALVVLGIAIVLETPEPVGLPEGDQQDSAAAALCATGSSTRATRSS